jgi:pilus assembly protein CpaB
VNRLLKFRERIPDRFRPRIGADASLLLAAAVAGVVAVLLVHSYLGRATAELGPMVEIIVPRGPMAAHTLITPENTTIQQARRGDVHDNAVPAAEWKYLIGRRTAIDLDPSHPFLWGYLEKPQVAGGMSARLRPGERAMTIAVDRVRGCGGFLQVGDRVDVLVTLAVPAGVEIHEKRAQAGQTSGSHDLFVQQLTKTVLRNVPILAIGDQDGDAFGMGATQTYADVTLRLQGDEPELLAFAVSAGPTTLVLRSAESDLVTEEALPAVSIDDLVRMTQAPPRNSGESEFRSFENLN